MTKSLDPVPYLDRLALGLLTESYGGYCLANDGTWYEPGTHPEISDETRERVYQTLRVSLTLPHDVPVINGRVAYSHGRSTGPLQQISREAVRALTPGASWGWGSISDTLNPALAALMFVAAVRVTTNPVYTAGGASLALSDPIAADVLRVQQPPMESAKSGNYSAAQVALARRIARGGPRFFSDGGK